MSAENIHEIIHEITSACKHARKALNYTWVGPISPMITSMKSTRESVPFKHSG